MRAWDDSPEDKQLERDWWAVRQPDHQRTDRPPTERVARRAMPRQGRQAGPC